MYGMYIYVTPQYYLTIVRNCKGVSVFTANTLWPARFSKLIASVSKGRESNTHTCKICFYRRAIYLMKRKQIAKINIWNDTLIVCLLRYFAYMNCLLSPSQLFLYNKQKEEYQNLPIASYMFARNIFLTQLPHGHLYM